MKGEQRPASRAHARTRDQLLDAAKKARIRVAEAQCEEGYLKRIREGKPGWQSAAWFLERKWPKRWALKHDGTEQDRTLF
jgi:hypothetical protein